MSGTGVTNFSFTEDNVLPNTITTALRGVTTSTYLRQILNQHKWVERNIVNHAVKNANPCVK